MGTRKGPLNGGHKGRAGDQVAHPWAFVQYSRDSNRLHERQMVPADAAAAPRCVQCGGTNGQGYTFRFRAVESRRIFYDEGPYCTTACWRKATDNPALSRVRSKR